jgi:hypothetical protein
VLQKYLPEVLLLTFMCPLDSAHARRMVRAWHHSLGNPLSLHTPPLALSSSCIASTITFLQGISFCIFRSDF